MALLGKSKKSTNVIGSGSTYPKLKDTVFGGHLLKVGRKENLINCDHIYVYTYDDLVEDCEYSDFETGINKKYFKIDDIDWIDEHKHIDHKGDREDMGSVSDIIKNLIGGFDE